MAEIRKVAESEKLPPAPLANRSEVEALVAGKRELPIIQGWRFKLVGKIILDMALIAE